MRKYPCHFACRLYPAESRRRVSIPRCPPTFAPKLLPVADPITASFLPAEWPLRDLHQLMLGAVSPRPIAFVSTLDAEGQSNLAPFSWFNVMSVNPPILVFSPARRGRDNTTKHTYDNLTASDTCTVNIVGHAMTHQMVLASTEYPAGVDEFVKAGFTKAPSQEVAPPRVAESPVQFECQVRDIVTYAEKGGAGNIVLAEVLRVHYQPHILGNDGRIDPERIDTVGRLGKNFYTRAKAGLFELSNPPGHDNLGMDGLPPAVQRSPVLTLNERALLAREPHLPGPETIEQAAGLFELAEARERFVGDAEAFTHWLHGEARKLIAASLYRQALALLLAGEAS